MDSFQRRGAVDTMGCAKYVGRVGALAVALGIGVAMGNAAPVARADDTPSRESDSPTSARSDAANSAVDSRGLKLRPTPRAARANRPAAATASDMQAAIEAPQTSVRAEPVAYAATVATPPRRVAASRPTRAALTTPVAVIAPRPATESAKISALGSAASTTTPLPAHAEHSTTTPLPAHAEHPATATQVQLRRAMSSTRTLQPLYAERFATAVESVKVCACKLVLQVFQAVGSVVATQTGVDAPAPPAENPVLLALATWVRREIDRVPAIANLVDTIDAKVKEFTQLAIDRLTIATQDVVKCANPTEEVALPADLDRTVIASGLDQPTDFRFLPDGRILVVEKTGGVKILENTSQLSTPITAGVIGAATDRELGAVELDPHFEDNGYFYVAYTTTDYHDRLSRFTLANDVMDPASEFVLIDEADSGPMHHGNTMLFGPDGKLYWAFGDNAFNTNGQDLSTIYGKILRINPDGTIPEDNPFYTTPGARKEIYAYGFRNPFRMTFTPTGELLVGDVGDQAWEELNNVVAGGNYGWPSAEGSCSDCGYINPVYEYPHTPPPGRAGSITTVSVYSGTSLPEQYQNKVFISDYTLRWMKMLTFDPTYTTVLDEQTIDTDAGTAVQLLQGPDGNLYQLNIFPGTLYRIAASGGNRAPSAILTASPSNGLSPLTVQFSSAGSTDPDAGTTLSYAWDFGDGATSAEANPTWTYTSNGSYTATLTVSDGEKTGNASQKIIVGSTAPDVQILTPVDESRYNAGNTISFSATATDPEDGALPDSAYRWTVIFHHADHIHPYQDNIIGPTGTVLLSTSDHNVDTTWYEFAVTVTDSSGLSTTRSTSIKPNLVALTFTSSETEATYTIDGIPRSGVHTEQAVVGVVRELDVPSPQVVNGAEFTFNNWSDGGAKKHQISTPATNTTYTVTFNRTDSLA